MKKSKDLTPEQLEEQNRERAKKASNPPPNPPRTTLHGITAPKFGSAGSGGAELEPGPERD